MVAYPGLAMTPQRKPRVSWNRARPTHRLLHSHKLAETEPEQDPAEKLGDQEKFEIPWTSQPVYYDCAETFQLPVTSSTHV